MVRYRKVHYHAVAFRAGGTLALQIGIVYRSYHLGGGGILIFLKEFAVAYKLVVYASVKAFVKLTCAVLRHTRQG